MFRVKPWRIYSNIPQSFSDPKKYLVHDPKDSLRTGDVVAIVPGWRTSKHKRHVVKHIIAPYGQSIEERPAVPTADERIEEMTQKRLEKEARRRKEGNAGRTVNTNV